MRDYGKVHTSFWSSSNIRELSEDGRALALYLLTCPHGTIAGVFRLPDGYACEDMQWTPERVSKGFAELLSNGFANRCGTTKWAWVTKHLEWNPPENPNQRKAIAKVAGSVPDECSWKREFMRVSGLSDVPASEPKEEPLRNPSATVSESGAVAVTGAVTGEKPRESPSGSRLPADWSLPDDWRDWAKAERPDLDVKTEAASFADYWHGKPGKDGRKTDWQATWRNWIRRARGSPPNGRAVTAAHSPAASRPL
jgi:hypothetical protein